MRAAAEWATRVAQAYGVPVTVTSARRTWGEQDRLFRNYREGGSKYPAARPGYSAHQYGLAFDSVVAPELQNWWTYVRELAGFQVPRNDIIHAQYPDWKQFFSWS